VELYSIDTSLTAAFPLPDPDVPRLTHPSKARPRNQKQHSAKRPVVCPESLLIENAAGRDDGLDAFFSSASTSDKQQAGPVKQKPVATPRRFHFHLRSLLSAWVKHANFDMHIHETFDLLTK